jgi:2-oxoacid:acceptor oxidoreductase gamma subunit (pyruvate/2-ketoisovalerate family)
MIQLLFYGLGGQGALMGAQVFVEAAIRDGKWALVNTETGGVRRGGLVVCGLRLDDKPIRKVYPLDAEEGDCILVLGQNMVETIGLKVKPGVIAVLNAVEPPENIILSIKPSKVATVDATGVSIEVLGSSAIPITNTPMLGAISKATGFITLESLCGAIEDKWPGKLGEVNVKLAKLGYQRVRVKEF